MKDGSTDEESGERYPHLKHMMADYIKQLCEGYHLDLTVLKTKEERIDALQTIPNLRDITTPLSGAASKNDSTYELKGFHALTPDDDLECYLATFERLCDAQGIALKRWTILLEPCLTGRAQKAFHVVPADQKGNYMVVKAAIFKRL